MDTNFFKRIIDFTASFFGLLVLIPVFVLLIFALIASNKGNPFFVQARPGLYGKIFKLIKFKTMSDKKDTAGKLLPDSERLTAFGRFHSDPKY